MFKALFKKQMMEVNTWLLQNRKTGAKRSTSKMIAMVLVYLAIFIGLGAVFYFVGEMLCGPLASMGLGWLYFALMGLMALFLGVFGSVFNTYATMYKAKDNDFLLSMPIRPSYILGVRLLGVWMWSFIYEAIVFIPALIVYWKVAKMMGTLSFATVLFGIILLFMISIFILTLACILGWVVARISNKLRNKSFATVASSLVFFAVYYVVYFRANEILKGIIANGQEVGEKIRGSAYPLYLLGRAGEGDLWSMILFSLIILVFFAIVYYILSRTFIKIATQNRGMAKVKYIEKVEKVRSVDGAMLNKELRRFLASPIYMLNCGLGTLFLPIIGIFALIKSDVILSFLEGFSIDPSVTMIIVCAGLCTLASMNIITAPSVSLEGKNIWIAQSLPVSPWQALRAKIRLHLIITEIPAIFCAACIAVAIKPEPVYAVLMVVITAVFVLLNAAFGLAVNLKSPNLHWTSETVPVKQSVGVVLSLLGGWAFIVILGFLYYLMRNIVAADIYILACAIIIGATGILIIRWIKTRGTKIFEEL